MKENDLKSIEEFKEASAFHRLQNSILLGQTTIYLAATGALASLFIRDPGPNEKQTFMLKIAGILLSFIFFVITDRAYQFSYAARERAKIIGKKLGFELYSEGSVPKARIMRAVSAIKLLYIIVGVVWFLSIFIK